MRTKMRTPSSHLLSVSTRLYTSIFIFSDASRAQGKHGETLYFLVDTANIIFEIFQISVHVCKNATH